MEIREPHLLSGGKEGSSSKKSKKSLAVVKPSEVRRREVCSSHPSWDVERNRVKY